MNIPQVSDSFEICDIGCRGEINRPHVSIYISAKYEYNIIWVGRRTPLPRLPVGKYVVYAISRGAINRESEFRCHSAADPQNTYRIPLPSRFAQAYPES
jgi:hypothetical protein